MWKKLFTTLHVLLTLAAVGCCVYLLLQLQADRKAKKEAEAQNERHSANVDFALRRFLGVKWLGGDYELPDEVEHCGVALLHYKDGEFVGRINSGVYSREKGESRVLPKVLIWGPTQDGPKVISINGATSSSHGGAEHPLHRTQGLSRHYGPSDNGVLRGYRVIGSASTTEWRDVKEENLHGLEYEAKRHKEILFHVVKFFPTHDEAWKWASNQREEREN